MQHILTWDIFLFKFINGYWKCSLLDKIMPRLTHLGGAKTSILGCLILLGFSKNHTLGQEAVYAMAGSHLVVQVIKKFCTRTRPYLTIPGAKLWQSLALKDYSFPSGHTTASFSLATTLAVNFPVIAPFILALAFLVGLSRIYLGLHYPTDILIGAALGTVSALIAVV